MLCALLAIITGSIAMWITRKQPRKYSNRYMAWLGLFMGVFLILVPLFVLLLLF